MLEREERAIVLVLSAGDFPREGFTEVIACCGCETVWPPPGSDLAGKLDAGAPAVIVADEDVPRLRAALEEYEDVPVVLAAQTHGAQAHLVRTVFTRIRKPVSYGDLVASVERALVFRRAAISSWLDSGFNVAEMLGASAVMRGLYGTLTSLAVEGLHTAIAGERGVGREFLGRALHRRSARGALLHYVDCRTLEEDDSLSLAFLPMLDSFREPQQSIAGSTLLLGDVGTLSQSQQSELLMALREGRIRRPDDGSDVSLDVRVISTASESLGKLAEEGRFHPDLARILSGRRLQIPPLRERPDDILFLARRLVQRISTEPVMRILQLAPAAEATLLTYNWPGNARELRDVVGRAAALSDGSIAPDDLGLPRPTQQAFRAATAHILAERAQASLARNALGFDSVRAPLCDARTLGPNGQSL